MENIIITLIESVKNFINEVKENEELQVITKKAKYEFNLVIDQLKSGKPVFAYPKATKRLVVGAHTLVNVYKPILAKEDELNKAVKEVAEKAGKGAEYDALKEAYDAEREAYRESGVFSFKSSDITSGIKFNEFRNSLIENNEELKALRQEYWDILPIHADQFYGGYDGADPEKVRKLQGLPEYVAEVALPDDHPLKGMYWEAVRLLLPAKYFRAIILDSKRYGKLKTKFEENNSNGTWDYNSYRDRTKDEEEKTQNTKDFEAIKLRVGRFLYNQGENPNLLDDQNKRGLFNICRNIIFTKDEEAKAEFVKNGGNEDDFVPTYAWAFAFACEDLIVSRVMNVNDVMKMTDWSYEDSQKFITYLDDKQKFMNECVKSGKITKLTYDFRKLSMFGKNPVMIQGKTYNNMFEYIEPIAFGLVQKALIDNVTEADHKEALAEKENTKELWECYANIPSTLKKNPKLNKAEILKGKFTKEKKEAIDWLYHNSKDFISGLSMTRNWKFATDDAEWNELLEEKRKALRAYIEAAAQAEVTGDKSEFEQLDTVEIDERIITLKAAYKMLGIINEQIVSGAILQ